MTDLFTAAGIVTRTVRPKPKALPREPRAATVADMAPTKITFADLMARFERAGLATAATNVDELLAEYEAEKAAEGEGPA